MISVWIQLVCEYIRTVQASGNKGDFFSDTGIEKRVKFGIYFPRLRSLRISTSACYNCAYRQYTYSYTVQGAAKTMIA